MKELMVCGSDEVIVLVIGVGKVIFTFSSIWTTRCNDKFCEQNSEKKIG